MLRSRIVAIWFTVLWAVCGVTFITFISFSVPFDYLTLPVLIIMWGACGLLTYSAVKIHREYWK